MSQTAVCFAPLLNSYQIEVKQNALQILNVMISLSLSLHKRAVKFLMPVPNLDYKQKCCALKLLPLDKQLLLNKCVLMQKVVHGKAPQYLKDLMIPSERLHVHGNKQLLPRTRIDIFKTSFSFSGSLAWNSLAHHLRYPMELKTFKRKAFQALAKPL